MGAPPADPPVGIPSDADADDGVAIRVARSGGIAGMTRRWSVEPAGDDREQWLLLVDRCPWDEKQPSGSGADRFVWRIEARVRRVRREQVIPEEHLSGPWRELVDAVRAADGGDAPQR
ncbi:protealysin inhibitor emfourin [Microbacterium azadirachtae]|jgi:hypothetical protein|uniref:protealysin inhibitor emfourin n=1 Tax=Microbacterium azadirachtae TaxID=582680 RepID=UPI003F751F13